jgi:hypothetical protein
MTPRTAAASAAMVAVCLLAACSSADEIDGVLWGQMDAAKQPVFAAFDQTREMDRAAIIDDMVSDGGVFPGSYLDRADGDLARVRSGGVFLSRLAEGPDWASIDVLISSGPRNPASDPLARTGPYSGPPYVYTCFQAVVEFTDDRVSDWAWDEEAECDSVIVAALDENALFMPLHRFAG